MKKKNILKAISIGAMGLTLAISTTTIASTNSGKDMTSKSRGRVLDEETREAVREAIKENDFESWKEARLKALEERYQKGIDSTNEDTFAQKVERYQKMSEHKLAIESAMENQDYDAWVDAVESRDRFMSQKLLNAVSEEEFPRLVEAFELAQEGQFEEADEIRKELGIGGKMKKHRLPMPLPPIGE
jgi:hypothetical protein